MNRFQQMFDIFRDKVEPMLKEGEMHALVFSYKHDLKNGGGEFRVYRNHQVQDMTRFFVEGAQLIQPANQIVFEDTVWFFYEDIKERVLEAHVSYIDSHRDRIVIQPASPLLTLRIDDAPYISGLCRPTTVAA